MSAEPVRLYEESNDNLPWLPLPEKGWREFRILPPEKTFLKTFEDLPFDQYAPHCQRYRRFSQFKMSCFANSWMPALLPHRPFIQSAEYNQHSGGILREFEPLKCNIEPYVDEVFSMLKIDPDRFYHLDVHQYRVCATPGAEGISVPEGPHRDGQQYVVVLVFRRHQITGAECRLYDPKTGQPFYKIMLEENEGIVLDDEKLLHNATNIKTAGGQDGHRDYLVLNINEWEKRRYGEAFECAMSDTMFSSILD